MVLLLCLTFIGQTMASTVMSYHMMAMQGMDIQKQTQKQADDMSTMNHSDHQMMSDSTPCASMEISNESAQDCCSTSCHCVTGGCSSTVVLIKDIANNFSSDLSLKITSITSLVQSQQLTSLYRPPILS